MNWFTVVTANRKEEVAQAKLESVGLETFLPRIHAPQDGKRHRNVIQPLFPQYLFVYSDPEELQVYITTWKLSYTNIGIFHVLTAPGNIPIPIDSLEIYWLRLQLDPITGILTPDTIVEPRYTHNFQPGDQVVGRPQSSLA